MAADALRLRSGTLRGDSLLSLCLKFGFCRGSSVDNQLGDNAEEAVDQTFGGIDDAEDVGCNWPRPPRKVSTVLELASFWKDVVEVLELRRASKAAAAWSKSMNLS